MASLTREQILARRADMPREKVDVPALGGEVYVRVLSVSELNELLQALKSESSGPVNVVQAVIAAACDESGLLLFTAADTDALLGLPFGAVKAVSDAAIRVNGIGDSSFEDARKK